MLDPFKKHLKDLTDKDLIELKEVAEGWFIDYKQDIIDIKDIARHLTSFANTYGGWIFFGIKDDQATRYADTFDGITKENLNILFTRIREASGNHSTPPVYYETKIISGPSTLLGLDENKYILILKIPEGEESPYIHSSGRIYKRISDHSKPEAETNRYAVDKLVEKGTASDALLEQFVSDIPKLSRGQSECPYIHIFLIPDQEQHDINDTITIQEFKEAVSNKPLPISVSFDHVFPAKYGFIARCVQDNLFTHTLPSIRYWHDGTFRISMPINNFNLNSFLADDQFQFKKEFLEVLKTNSNIDINIIDLTRLGTALMGILNIITHLKLKTSDARDLLAYINITNVSRKCPYIDNKLLLEYYKQYGIPIIEEDSIQIPRKVRKRDLLRTSFEAHQDDELNIKQLISTSIPLIFRIYQSLGIHIDPENPSGIIIHLDT